MNNFLLFDFDGTITRTDTTKYLVLELLKLRPFRIFGITNNILKMIFSKNEKIIQKSKNEILGYLIDGLNIYDIEKICKNFNSVALPLFRSSIIMKINNSISEGHKILIVTASPQFAVQACFSSSSIFVLGTKYRQCKKIYTRELQGIPCYGENKVILISEWVSKNSFYPRFLEGWSDSFSDRHMLKLATERFWIGNKRQIKKLKVLDSEANFVLEE